MQEERKAFELVDKAKRNCILCSSLRFRSTEVERKNAQTFTQQAYQEFINEYNEFRKENASENKILNAKDNKTICLDAMAECKKCDKEFPLIKEVLSEIRRK